MKPNLTTLVIIFIIVWAISTIVFRINDSNLDRRLNRIELLIGLEDEANVDNTDNLSVGDSPWNTYTYTYAYEVVDAIRVDDAPGCFCYDVTLKDQDGGSFNLILDLVKFAAMGVNVNEILIKGEL